MNIQEFKWFKNEKYIFHYTKLNTALEKILPTAKLKFSKLENTSDPQEYKYIYHPRIHFGNNIDIQSQESRDANAHLNNLRLKKFRMISFTRNTEEYSGFNRSRMWDQYGDKQRGICLVFDKEIIEKEIKREENDFEFIQMKSMNYEIEINQVAYFYHLTDGIARKENYKEHLLKYKKEFFFTKTNGYKDEAEFRVLIYSDLEIELFINIKSSIVAIMIGTRFPDVYLPIDEYDIKSYRAYWNKNDYILLEPKPIGV